jgi:HEAT repeat protein
VKDINGVKHFFISYSRLDAEFGENLISRLHGQGFDTWVDTEQIPPGYVWRTAIDEAIRASAAVIVVMTPAAKASEYVTYEWAYALGAGVPVIPVLLDRIDLHPVLAALQYLEFTVPTHLRPWERLFASLRAVMAKEATKVHLTPDEIRGLVAGFDSPNPAVRREAVGTLATTGQDDAREALGGALQHHRRDVRIEAAIRLVETGQPEPARVIPLLIEGLYGPPKEVSERASQALIHIGTPAVTAVIATLQSQHAGIQKYAVKILHALRNMTAVPALIELLRQEREKVLLHSSIDEYELELLESIVKALGEIRHSDAIPAIIELVERFILYNEMASKGPVNRFDAHSLGRTTAIAINALRDISFPDASVIIELVERLLSQEEQSRIPWHSNFTRGIALGRSITALGAIGASGAVPVLLKALQLDHTTAGMALVEIGGPAVIEDLRRLLHDPACSPSLQNRLPYLLQRLGVTEV